MKNIANDLNLCDVGIALTTGKLRKNYIAHRNACFAEISRMNEEDGLVNMTDDELLEALCV